MSDLPNFNDLFRVARDEALARNGQLSAEAISRDGTDANILVACDAAVGEEVVGQLQRIESGLFLDSASGPALDKLVFDRYNLLRKPAAPGYTTVLFELPVANTTAFSILSGTILQNISGNQYITTVDTTFIVGALAVEVPVRSVLAGIDQAAGVGTINTVVSNVPGAPGSLFVVNIYATAGADDQEGDPSLRDRARKFFTSARRGTRIAIEQGALAVTGVRSAQAFEVIDSYGRPARAVQLTVTDAFTETLASYTSSPPASYATQSQQLALTVFNALDDVRAAGIYVAVSVAQVILQPVVLRLAYQAGVDTNAISTAARAAAVTYVNGLRPGDTLSLAALRVAVQVTAGLVVTGNEVASPVGDIVANPLQVLRTSLAIVARA